MSEKGSILVVDDDTPTRELLADFLDMWRYAAYQAHDGRQALAMLANGLRPDLVITDYNMSGGMLGDEVVRTVKAGYPGIAVVLASSIHPNVLRDLAQAIGADDYLPKPFRSEDLQALVERFISKSQ